MPHWSCDMWEYFCRWKNSIGVRDMKDFVIGCIFCFFLWTTLDFKNPGIYEVKCADTNGNITIDTVIDALDFKADDLTFVFELKNTKVFVVSGFCFVREQ